MFSFDTIEPDEIIVKHGSFTGSIDVNVFCALEKIFVKCCSKNIFPITKSKTKEQRKQKTCTIFHLEKMLKSYDEGCQM